MTCATGFSHRFRSRTPKRQMIPRYPSPDDCSPRPVTPPPKQLSLFKTESAAGSQWRRPAPTLPEINAPLVAKKKTNGITMLQESLETANGFRDLQKWHIKLLRAQVKDLQKDLEIVHGSKLKLHNELQTAWAQVTILQKQMAVIRHRDRDVRLSLAGFKRRGPATNPM